jgi:hypothetical protein
VVTARDGAARLAILNAGTIPDRGLYGVFLAHTEGKSIRVGELDEEMVFESHPNETFILGASTWRIEDITHDRVLVVPAPGEPGKMPFWKGDGPGRSSSAAASALLSANCAACPSPQRLRAWLPNTISTPTPPKTSSSFLQIRKPRPVKSPMTGPL